ncbi:MAG TPA: histidine kinase [Chitinophagaceae bacterium]|nr:histidine kinase [Chitinophagaceae bacterium]
MAFNLVFWLLYFLYEWFGLAALSGQYGRYFINACMALPLAFAVSWITVHLLIKKYYRKGDRLTFWILQLSVALVLLLIRRCINYYLIYPVWFPEAQVVPLFSFGKLIVEWVNLYLITGLYALFYFVRSWYEERQRVQSLLQEKTVAELEGLKAQVQPHFIFNALNNIYATALRASPETARLIGHLSSFLNYNLYEARQEAVPLTAELHYLEHYLELQQNRYGDKLDTSVTVYGETGDLYIAPLLLLPLLENCFKHGIAGSLHPGWIRVEVSRQVDHFSIKLENSVEEGSPEGGARSGGLGLPNVQKRLELLYPGTHQFKTVREPHSYLVVLKINLPK